MLLKWTDFNHAGELITSKYQEQWKEVQQSIQDMPLHVSGSDQAGIKGNLIFNPKGTNAHLKEDLPNRSWTPNPPIPADYKVLGTDVDFEKDGILLEVQFSNYPFLSNNILRSEMFYKRELVIGDSPVKLLMIVTKAHMFPASQSTLYYEQAVSQLGVLERNNAFDMPVRVIGLFEEIDTTVEAVWTGYEQARHSRKEARRENKRLWISPGKSQRSRCILTFAEDSDPSLFGK